MSCALFMKTICLISLTLSLLQVPLIDFTLSNATRFYSLIGNTLGVKVFKIG